MIMKTLVIHPEDKTTYFLKAVYSKLKNYTLITSGSKNEVNRAISSHDRIMMLGHGSSSGLLSVGQFEGIYVIDSETAPLLKEKECVFIWCHADKFVKAHGLKGLFSGMFVSEVVESRLVGIGKVPQEIVDESNSIFSYNLGLGIGRDLYHAYHRMMNVYERLAETNVVANYNARRLYIEL